MGATDTFYAETPFRMQRRGHALYKKKATCRYLLNNRTGEGRDKQSDEGEVRKEPII